MKRGQRVHLPIQDVQKKMKIGVVYTPDPYEKQKQDVDFVARSHQVFYWYGNRNEESKIYVDSKNCLGGFAGDDDDRIVIDLSKVDLQDKIEIFLSLFHPNGEDLTLLNKVKLKIYSEEATYLEEEIPITETFKDSTAVLIGEVYNYKGEWRFKYIEGLWKVNHFKEIS